MTTIEIKELLKEFLDRWTIENVQNLKLQEYVGLGNRDTFCQWVETKTKMLGSNRGMSSIKFGIYERSDQNKKPKYYKNDDKYSWMKGYGNNRESAFEIIKSNIIEIIKLSEIGKFDKIDDISLPDLFKWKIAFLYSNERLIPIFNRDVLLGIADNFDLKTGKKIKISEIQNVMMLNKPANLNVYEFMGQLYQKFGDNKDKIEIAKTLKLKRQRKTIRKAANERNTNSQIRKFSHSYVAEQKHNKIQKALETLLINDYGKENVILEENFVDIKLIQPDYISFYEVKSSSYATECIKEALGQILLYSLNDRDTRPKKHIVVGLYPPTDNDNKYIEFLKENLKLDFDYLNVAIE